MSETSTSQDPVSYYIDHTIYTGRPADTTSRLPKEIRTYDLLDSLGIAYARADHDTLPTMEACQEVGNLLGIEICKNLFLCSRQETNFYLLLLPGDKKFKTKEVSSQLALPDFPSAMKLIWRNSLILHLVLSVYLDL